MYRSRRTFEVNRLRRAIVANRSRTTFAADCLHWVCAIAALATILAVLPSVPARAQEPYPFESDLMAKRRLYPDVGPGFREIHRGPNGNYYVLTAPAPAVLIYDGTRKLIGRVPSEAGAAAKGSALVYGESFDVDQDGHVVVCDRGSNAVKIYSSSGTLSASIHVPSPVSVVFLSGGESR